MTAWLIAAVAALIAIIGAFMRGTVNGASKERAKQASERIEAQEIGDQVDNDVGALPPAKAREELSKWSKR